MGIQNWSDEIIVFEISDDPQFTDEIDPLIERVEAEPRHIIVNFSALSHMNSSNIARLLRLRRSTLSGNKKLILCDINSQVWGIITTTGLDKIFDINNSVATSLATLQMNEL